MKTSIVRTRYRDIPFDEVHAVHSMMEAGSVDGWAANRGRSIEIVTPGKPCECGELAYSVNGGGWACGHLAEIGD